VLLIVYLLSLEKFGTLDFGKTALEPFADNGETFSGCSHCFGEKKMNYFIGKFLPVVTKQQFLGCLIIPIDIGIELIIGNLEIAGVACFFRSNIARKDGITLGKVAKKCVKSN
jgi:hypothetical protein